MIAWRTFMCGSTRTAALLLSAWCGLALLGCASMPGGDRPLASLAPMLAPANEATVAVFAGEIEEPGPRLGDPPNVGAGFYLGSPGLIATAAHVVSGMANVAVRYNDGAVERATLLGVDEGRDVALLKVARGAEKLPILGSGRRLKVGDWVIALGEPYGMGRSASAGIVGNVNRHFAEDEEQLFIQTDVAVNPGNSGGPLVDAQGRIVAMSVRVVTGGFGMSGLTLSVPIEDVLQSARVILSMDAPAPPLGAEFEDLTPLQMLAMGAQVRGALVVFVRPDSVADSSGLKRGDLIVAIGDERVTDSLGLARKLAARRGTDSTKLSVVRARHVLTLILAPPRAAALAAQSSQERASSAP